MPANPQTRRNEQIQSHPPPEDYSRTKPTKSDGRGLEPPRYCYRLDSSCSVSCCATEGGGTPSRRPPNGTIWKAGTAKSLIVSVDEGAGGGCTRVRRGGLLSASGPSTKAATFKRSAPIYVPGNPADAVLYVQKGTVRLSVLAGSGKEAVVSVIGPGRSSAKAHWPDNRSASARPPP